MPDQTSTPTATLHRWSDITPESMNPLLTRQFVSGQKSMIARVMLKQGCVVPEHSHVNEQTALILSGALEFSINEESITVRAGEFIIIPPNVPHSATALEDTEDIDFFAPPRQDWLDKSDTYLR